MAKILNTEPHSCVITDFLNFMVDCLNKFNVARRAM